MNCTTTCDAASAIFVLVMFAGTASWIGWKIRRSLRKEAQEFLPKDKDFVTMEEKVLFYEEPRNRLGVPFSQRY